MPDRWKDELTRCAEGFSLLCIDDRPEALEALYRRLHPFFPTVDRAEDSRSGLESWRKKRHDLVIIGHLTPEEEEAQLLLSIRAYHPTQTVLASGDTSNPKTLTELMDSGVDGFLSLSSGEKGFFTSLLRTVRNLYNTRSLLRYKKGLEELVGYMESQERSARKKQLAAVVNDLEGSDRWKLETLYKASDILSGDFYSAFLREDGSILLYMLDAQSHGIQPALTAFTVAAAIKLHIHQSASLAELLERILPAARSVLEEAEQLSYFFLLAGPEGVEYAGGGVYPPLLFDGETCRSLGSNNLPVMEFTTKMETVILEGVAVENLLIYSDGATERRETVDDAFLESVLKNPKIAKEFFAHMEREEAEDDTTLLRLTRL